MNNQDKFLESIQTPPGTICGDIKINILKSNNLTERYLFVLSSNGFDLGKSDGKHFSNGNESLLDHYLVKRDFHHSCLTCTSHCFSDQ